MQRCCGAFLQHCIPPWASVSVSWRYEAPFSALRLLFCRQQGLACSPVNPKGWPLGALPTREWLYKTKQESRSNRVGFCVIKFDLSASDSVFWMIMAFNQITYLLTYFLSLGCIAWTQCVDAAYCYRCCT